jgi:cobalt/nickel transport system permease protein
MMLPVHLAIGLVEGIVTAGVINYVRAARPEIIRSVAASMPLGSGVSVRKVFLGFLIIAVLAGGFLSWFASANPDGLEWSIEKIYGSRELPEQEHGTAAALKKIQDKTAFLPDYGFRKDEAGKTAGEPGKKDASWPGIEAGRSVSGLLGAAIVLGLIFLVGFVIKTIRRRT